MINWNNIDTVFLDMDGTLLDLHYDNYFWLTHLPQRLAELKSIERSEAEKRLHSMFERHHGSLNWYCLDFWADSLDIDLMALKHEVAGKIGYRPNAENFLAALHANDYRVVLVTNAHQDSIAIKFQYTDLEKYLHDIVCSHDYRSPKEDQHFWQAFHQDKPFRHKSTVFIDDNLAVLSAARKAGLQHLFAIASPDSRKAALETSEFPLLHDFADVLPGR
ncbi:MAG: GMP/IMP nucleotidase [Oleiphilus sp.]|nr:MAG: GMP/IMP nucleotidase [Oleiphilus sp.]